MNYGGYKKPAIVMEWNRGDNGELMVLENGDRHRFHLCSYSSVEPIPLKVGLAVYAVFNNEHDLVEVRSS